MPRREAGHSPPSNSEVKNASILPYVFMAAKLLLALAGTEFLGSESHGTLLKD
jgi:hypothetical protein